MQEALFSRMGITCWRSPRRGILSLLPVPRDWYVGKGSVICGPPLDRNYRAHLPASVNSWKARPGPFSLLRLWQGWSAGGPILWYLSLILQVREDWVMSPSLLSGPSDLRL